MREIKFRVWFKTINAMYDPQLLTNSAVVDGRKNKPGVYLPFDEDTVLMQYTGLKDMNGKEIYEGDVVDRLNEHGDMSRQIAWVQYDNSIGAFGIGRGEIWNLFSDFGLTDIKVIGNIYENKELIEIKMSDELKVQIPDGYRWVKAGEVVSELYE